MNKVEYPAEFLNQANLIFGNYENNDKGTLQPLEAVVYEETI